MIFTRTRKRDGAVVYFFKYRIPKSLDDDRSQITEKAGVLGGDAPRRQHKQMEAKALSLCAQQRLALENGNWVHPHERGPAAGVTFPDLVDKFLAGYQSRTGSMTYYKERSVVWLEHFKRKRADLITPHDVDRFRKARAGKVGASTVRKDLVSLSTLFQWAKVRHLVDANPAASGAVLRPPEPKHRAGYLSDDQERDLLAECPPWLQQMVRWCISTGMDREEVVELGWRDLDLESGILHAPRGKTGVPRQIPLLPSDRAILKRAGRVRTVEAHGRVFLGPDGCPVTVAGAKTALRRAYARSGLEVSGQWKILRHTMASRLAMAGVEMLAIAKLLGHSAQAVTERYAHLSPGYLLKARRKAQSRARRPVSKRKAKVDSGRREVGKSGGK